jgi:phospholipid-binding lipoprotein MlaA
MIGALVKQVSKVSMAEVRPAHARRHAGLAATALGLIVAAGLMATASPALAQTAAEPDATQPQDTAPVVDAPQVQDPGLAAYDPLEGFNRASFGVSMGLDRAVIGPIAHGYMAVTPKPVRNRVSSVIYNLGEPSTALNDVLQGHPKRFGVTTSRFVINSTIGLLGLFDVAAGMGLQGHGADFGQTFGRYGVKPGPYLYVPVMGPLSFREGVGRALDFATDPVGIVGGGYRSTFGATRLGVGVVDVRARADGAFRALDDSVDPYATARSAYGQYRESFLREATGEVQALPDFDDAPSTSSEVPPSAPTPSAGGPQ